MEIVKNLLCGGHHCYHRQSPDSEQMKFEAERRKDPVSKVSHENKNAVAHYQGTSVGLRKQADALAQLAREIRRM